jgi:hypothetical protein
VLWIPVRVTQPKVLGQSQAPPFRSLLRQGRFEGAPGHHMPGKTRHQGEGLPRTANRSCSSSRPKTLPRAATRPKVTSVPSGNRKAACRGPVPLLELLRPVDGRQVPYQVYRWARGKVESDWFMRS